MVYDGCLKCGSQSVANRVLSLPNRNAVAQVCCCLSSHACLGRPQSLDTYQASMFVVF